MATTKKFAGRDYKKKATTNKTVPKKEAAPEPERRPAEPEEKPVERKSYGGQQQGSYSRGGGYNRGGGGGRHFKRNEQGNGDSEFVTVTGLFGPTKKGGYTVFLKPEMLEKLAEAKEGDLLGISPNERDGWSLWFAKK